MSEEAKVTVPSALQLLYYEAWMAGARMGVKIRDELGLDVSDDKVMELGEKVGVSIAIEMKGGGAAAPRGGARGGGGGKAVYAQYPCPSCNSKVYDNRSDPNKPPKGPDFRCSDKRCSGGSKGMPWAAWMRDFQGNPLTIEQVFKVEAEHNDDAEFSNEGLMKDDDLPF